MMPEQNRIQIIPATDLGVFWASVSFYIQILRSQSNYLRVIIKITSGRILTNTLYFNTASIVVEERGFHLLFSSLADHISFPPSACHVSRPQWIIHVEKV